MDAAGLPDPIKVLAYENEINNIKDPIYNLCPNSSGIFHIYYNKTDT